MTKKKKTQEVKKSTSCFQKFYPSVPKDFTKKRSKKNEASSDEVGTDEGNSPSGKSE